MEKLAATSWAEEQAPRRWTVWMGRGSHKATSTARAAAHLRGTTEHQTEEGFTDTNHNAVVGNAVADDVSPRPTDNCNTAGLQNVEP